MRRQQDRGVWLCRWCGQPVVYEDNVWRHERALPEGPPSTVTRSHPADGIYMLATEAKR